MTDTAIRVENISTMYNIGLRKDRYDTLRDQVVVGINALLKRTHCSSITKTVLGHRDISLEIKKREVVGHSRVSFFNCRFANP
jgi:hypothetical protein